MAINFGDGSIQEFSSKIIQVKRNLRSSQITTTSGTMSDVLTIGITPKSSGSVIHCEFTGIAYLDSEPAGVRGRFYDDTDSARFGTSLGTEDPLIWRFDMQSLSNGNIYAYAGVTWRTQEASWGTSNHNIKFQISQIGNNAVGFLAEFMPCTFTIMEVME